MAIRAFFLVILIASIGAAQRKESVESFYDSRFPNDCRAQEIPSTIRQQLKSQLRSEFKKINPKIEAIGVLEIKCALDDKKKLLGAMVLGYGTVADQDAAYDQFRKTDDIGELLANEQFGVFQYNPLLTKLLKTVTVFPSQRWRDYLVTIKLTPANKLSLRANGSYGDGLITKNYDVTW